MRRPFAAGCALTVLLAASCRRPPGARQVRAAFFSGEETSFGIPDVRTREASLWWLERSYPLAAYRVELKEPVFLQLRTFGTLRLLVLSGRLDLRVGPAATVVGAGAYASVPAGTSYRARPLGKDPARLLVWLMPDRQNAVPIEAPPEDARGER
ncbi:MAG: hypothetical protein A2X36_07135 [Elusimicrobia bacterium GWA2_69_24]|nr:MAG: hypothetical protein A2X36_07135 [Elusimicrobia bacterium GWA2_69_24]HBL15204.1 hypothetical protein [Elusimicrobiota bacterium]